MVIAELIMGRVIHFLALCKVVARLVAFWTLSPCSFSTDDARQMPQMILQCLQHVSDGTACGTSSGAALPLWTVLLTSIGSRQISSIQSK